MHRKPKNSTMHVNILHSRHIVIFGMTFITGYTDFFLDLLGSLSFYLYLSILNFGRVLSYQYHLGRGHIAASMKATLYHLLEQRAADCRYFVIPVWRGSGYTTMFAQVQMSHMLFTGVEDYKARGTQAAPYFTVTYYKEFAESKDLVLIRGDVVFTSKLSDSEAKWLLETAHSFYLNDVRYKLVERFNKQTHDFDFKDVLQALEMPNL